MAKRSGWAWLLGASAFALFGGAALAASTPQQSRRKDGDNDSGQEEEGRRESKVGGTPPGFFDDTSGQTPLRDDAVSEAEWSAKFQAHRDGFRDGVLLVQRRLIQLRAQMILDRAPDEDVERVTSALKQLGAVVSAVAGAYGVLVQGFVLLSQGLSFAVVKWGGRILGSEDREFTGWKDNCWWLQDLPIYGPDASKFWPELTRLFALKVEQQRSLAKLISAYPNGPGPKRVEVTPQGDFDYLFNPSRPGDLSQAERDANRVYGMQVYSPADVTLRGPRGFDPQRPLGWKVPGERASVFDRVVKAMGPAGGL